MATSGNDTFQEAVEACIEIRGDYKPGLQAMGLYSKAISPANPRLLSGSVDIDKATKALYPEDSRWDYTIGYKEKAYFVEVHPANTSNVQEMLNKVVWLKSWLSTKGKPLKEKSAKSPYYWVPSGKVAILRNSKQYRQLGMCGIKLTSRVELK